ncbi:MAG: Wzt carbohydrate-binding domain-containing protein, partial [Rhizonema sp. NSF051]|nr:Wzt carbohydrate-binding domain-containing protein [Rhizonema sp. NSF051]
INPFTLQAYKAYQKVERFGTGCAEIISFEVLDNRNEKAGFVYPKDVIKLFVQVVTYANIQKPIVGIMLYDRFRVAVTGFNTSQYHHQLSSLLPNQLLTVEFSLEWPEIQGGNYVLEPAIADGSQENHEMLDWLQFPLNIVSGVTDLTFGVLRIPSVDISHRVQEHQSVLTKFLEKT